MVNVLIADDHFAVRLGLEMLVQDTIEEELSIHFAGNGLEVLEQLKERNFDILLTDLNMPGLEGLPMLSQIRAIYDTLKILVISVNPEEFYASKCIQLGAYGFVSKNAKDEELKKAIISVFRGEKYISEFQQQMLDTLIKKDGDVEINPFNYLSSREMEVLMLLLKGNGILEVSNLMDISQSTASTFKGRIYKKIGVNSFIDLIKKANHFGVYDSDSTGL